MLKDRLIVGPAEKYTELLGLDVIWKLRRKTLSRLYILVDLKSSEELYLLDRLLFSIQLSLDMPELIVGGRVPKNLLQRDILADFTETYKCSGDYFYTFPKLQKILIDPSLKSGVWAQLIQLKKRWELLTGENNI